jgi:hypothetical protein
METEDILKRRMMDSPAHSKEEIKEEVFELRETVYEYKSGSSRKAKSDNVIEVEKEKNIFRTANDRIDHKDPKHVLEFGELDKLKSERDLEEAKKTFVSLKNPNPENEKSYKLIQNKNSKGNFAFC